VTLASINAEEYPNIAKKYKVKSYPTIKVFGLGKKSVERSYNYEGGRTIKEIVEFGRELIEEAQQKKEKQDDSNILDKDDNVVELTESTFNKKVM